MALLLAFARGVVAARRFLVPEVLALQPALPRARTPRHLRTRANPPPAGRVRTT
jgi:hypothetical protein